MPSLRTRNNPPLQFKEDSSSDELSTPPSNLSDDEKNAETDYSDAKTPRNKRKTKPKAEKKGRDSNPVKTEGSKPVKTKVETEEDIYALPFGTSDEEEGSDDGLEDFTPRKRKMREPGQTLEEKLAVKKEEDVKDGKLKGERVVKDEKLDIKSPSLSLKRKSQDMLGSDDSKEQEFNIWSQRSGKRQSQGYGSKFRKPANTSFVDSLPPSSAPAPKSSATSVEQKEESSGDEKKKGAVFQVPREIDPDAVLSSAEIADSEDDSPLSSPVSYNSSDFPIEASQGSSKPKPGPEPQEYLCPLCKEPVEAGSLIMFRAQPRQRFRDQRKFCESHKQGRAEQEWEDKGYPTIDWNTFDKRIEAHFSDLEKLMVPYKDTYYRNVLNESIKQNKGKNFRLTVDGAMLEVISCGYYGTRGSDSMLRTITARYGRKLRRLAAEDQVVKQIGPVNYTQAVLVPALGVRLIAEDMKVDEDAARQIMRESITIGEKLNPTPNDYIPVEEDAYDDKGFLN